MDIHSFPGAKKIIKTLNSAGFEAYIVGGAVRDFILQRENHDIDIATNASAKMINHLFSKTVDTALKHGTVIVRLDQQSYEVTTYRGESLARDLELRDFTINSMAFHLDGTFIDPFSGRQDLRDKIIRGVKNPRSRFIEDPLRMLRAIRFASELAFCIEKETLLAICDLNSHIKETSIERVVAEFEKICLGKDVVKAFQYLNQSNLLENIQELNEINTLIKNQHCAYFLLSLETVTEVWSLLLYQLGCLNNRDILRSLKKSKKVISEVEKIVVKLKSLLERGFTEKDIYDLGIKSAKQAEHVRAALSSERPDIQKIERMFNQLPIKEKNQIDIKGEKILTFLKENDPKSRIGEIFSLIELAILARQVKNEQNSIICWLRKEGHIGA